MELKKQFSLTAPALKRVSMLGVYHAAVRKAISYQYLFLTVILSAGSVGAATVNDGFFGSIWAWNGPHGVSSSATDPLFGTIYNQITPQNAGKWPNVEPTQGNFDWSQLDAMYEFAGNKNLVVKEHNFVWGEKYPSYVTSANVKKEIVNWMTAYMTRYGSKTHFIDVVNEPLCNPFTLSGALGGGGATGWDWEIWCYQQARNISKTLAPNVRLLVNEFGVISNDEWTTKYMDLCTHLKAAGLLDGIGEQGHFYEDETKSPIQQLRRNLDRLGTLGLPLYISEFDLDIADDNAHAARFEQLFPMFWEHACVRGVTLWGHHQIPKMWRQDGYLVKGDGTDRKALTWLRRYLAAHPLPGKGNLPPTSFAGTNQSVTLPVGLTLTGIVTDDGAPGAVLTQTWSMVSGPGLVTFASPNAVSTKVQFDKPGSYALRLTANDGIQKTSSDVVVTVTGTAINQPR